MYHRWNYTGDVNLTEGGLFWREDDADDYVLAVDVVPCSAGGGPSNLFNIVDGSIFLPVADPKRLTSALACLGWNLDPITMDLSHNGETVRKGSKEWRRMLVESFHAYHGLDERTETVVQIGPSEEVYSRGGEWSPEPDVILHGNAKLKNYVRSNFLR